MDERTLNSVLNNFACKIDLEQYVKNLPDDAEGVMVFRYLDPEMPKDEDGDDVYTLGYKVYGKLSGPEQLWLAHEAIEFAREENY
jgi:hypothetical protein